MYILTALASWTLLCFLAGLAIIIALKLVAGHIAVGGLLTGERRDRTAYFSFGRTQLLLCTAIVAFAYVRQVAANPSLKALPDLPTSELELLGGSQLLYLAGKTRALFFASSETV